MTSLVKPMLFTYTPATLGQPAVRAQPARPARTVVMTIPVRTTTVVDPSGSDSLDAALTGTIVTYVNMEVFVTYPATPAIPGSPAIPPTPAQYNVFYDRAWNSAADSITVIPPGSYVEYKVKPGSYGVFVGLASPSVYSTSPASYAYGVMTDSSGIRVMEYGMPGALLASYNTSEITLRVIRSLSGKVYYQVLGQAPVASPQPPIPSTTTIQASGLLYSSQDQIDAAVIAAFAIAEVAVPFPVTTDFVINTVPQVAFDITTDFRVGLEPAAIFDIITDFTATSSPVILGDVTFPVGFDFEANAVAGGSGTWVLPKVIMVGADYDAPGVGTWTLPRFTMTGTEQTYIPPAPTEGFWILPYVDMWGTGVDEDHGSGDWTLRAVAMIGTEAGVTYGQGNWTLPVRVVMRSSEPWWPADTLRLVSPMTSTQPFKLQQDLLLILNSAGVLTSTLTLTREYLLALLSGMVAQSSFSMLGVYPLSLLSSLIAGSFQSLQLPVGADLPSDAAVWVVNLDTNASAQYDDYGFNSFFQRGTDYFGVANDGIYRLTGDTDAGQPIQSLAALVRSTLGAQTVKHVPSVYVGAASDGALILRVDADGVVRYYRARTASTTLQQHRTDIGRGVRGTYWEFELLNQDGGDFEIADVTLLPVVRDRRI